MKNSQRLNLCVCLKQGIGWQRDQVPQVRSMLCSVGIYECLAVCRVGCMINRLRAGAAKRYHDDDDEAREETISSR